MNLAFGLTVLAIGSALLYMGLKGLSVKEFWQRVLGGGLSQ